MATSDKQTLAYIHGFFSATPVTKVEDNTFTFLVQNPTLYLIGTLNTIIPTTISSDNTTISCDLSQYPHLKPISEFPTYETETEAWMFIRALVDTCTIIRTFPEGPQVTVRHATAILNKIMEITKIVSYDTTSSSLTFRGVDAFDFLGKVYDKANGELNSITFNNTNYTAYRRLLSNTLEIQKCRFYKSDPSAIAPSKVRASDAGYDLTVIKVAKKFNSVTTLYDTGIKIALDHGYYAEIVPRSSLSKSGYMLANSIGIIDQSYRGNLFIALTKVDSEAPEIELPFRCCQLIIRKQVHVDMEEVQEDIENTSRGSGGFGSTGGVLSSTA